MLRIQEVPDSNLESETAYPDEGFSWFFSVPTGICWEITSDETMSSSIFIPFHPVDLIYADC
jgi:hypothetical protein